MTEPRIELEREEYESGERLLGAVWLNPDLGAVDHVEVRVGWRTEGKGDTDHVEVHRESLALPPEGMAAHDANLGFALRLPAAPLSYDGVIVKIRWWVEVRVRSRHPDAPRILKLLDRLLAGTVLTKDFRLGSVKSPRELSK